MNLVTVFANNKYQQNKKNTILRKQAYKHCQVTDQQTNLVAWAEMSVEDLPLKEMKPS